MKELIETLHGRLESLQCLSCAKLFKDRNTLKDHMRKKSHRGLNKEDRSFDKFYLINYLEIGKRWTQLPKDSEDVDSNDEQEWQELGNDCVSTMTELYCFFCDELRSDFQQLTDHLYDTHDFELVKLKGKIFSSLDT